MKVDVDLLLEGLNDWEIFELSENDEHTEKNIVDRDDHCKRVDSEYARDAAENEEKPTACRHPAESSRRVMRHDLVGLHTEPKGQSERDAYLFAEQRDKGKDRPIFSRSRETRASPS